MSAFKLVGQGLTWVVFAAMVGALAKGPRFAPHDPGQALLRVSMAHLSERLAPCRQLSEAERAALPPTRRVTEVCERGRAPTRLVLSVNGRNLLDRTVAPAGLSDNGRSYLMTEFPIQPGRHRIEVQLFDAPGADDPNHHQRFDAQIETGRATLIEIGDNGISLTRLDAQEAP